MTEVLDKNSKSEAARAPVERRQRDVGPPHGVERRKSLADRRLENNEDMLVFYLGNQALGLPIRDIREVLPQQPVTRVPLGRNSLLGLMNLRGEIISAMDLKIHLGVAAEKERRGDLMNIVIAKDDRILSLVVDRVDEVQPIAKSNFKPVPQTLDQSWREAASAVCRMPDGLLLILNTDYLLKVTNINSIGGSVP